MLSIVHVASVPGVVSDACPVGDPCASGEGDCDDDDQSEQGLAVRIDRPPTTA